MAFLRVCSGVFERDMTVHHSRQERQIRLSRPHRLFAQGRETVEYAYPGDIVGLSNPGLFTIGDTVSSASQIHFDTIPPFQPEIFAQLHNQSMDKYKQFNKGIEQLREEGVIQILFPVDTGRREPILAAVGDLQFDVVMARLSAEYNVEASIKRLNHTIACWVSGDEQVINSVYWPLESRRTLDHQNRLVILFESLWQLKHIIKNQPKLHFSDITGQPFLPASDL
jgi:peptide chain release factor 3